MTSRTNSRRELPNRPRLCHESQANLSPAQLTRWEQVTNDRCSDGLEPTRADALERSEDDELCHAMGSATQRGTGQEDDDPDQEDRFATKQIRELAITNVSEGIMY